MYYKNLVHGKQVFRNIFNILLLILSLIKINSKHISKKVNVSHIQHLHILYFHIIVIVCIKLVLFESIEF